HQTQAVHESTTSDGRGGLSYRYRQIACIFERLCHAQDVSIRGCDLELGPAVEHSLQRARNNAPIACLGKEEPQVRALSAQINVPVIRPGLAANGRSTPASHQLSGPVPEDGELETWRLWKRIAMKTEHAATIQ